MTRKGRLAGKSYLISGHRVSRDFAPYTTELWRVVAALERGKMKNSRMLCFALLTVVALLLASCATQPALGGFDSPGFLLGYWHGLTIFFALIGHVFDNSIRIYA